MSEYFSNALKSMVPEAEENLGAAITKVASDATLAGAYDGSRMWLTIETACLEQIKVFGRALVDRLARFEPLQGVIEPSDFDRAAQVIEQFSATCVEHFDNRQYNAKGGRKPRREFDGARLRRVTDDAVNEIAAAKQVYHSKISESHATPARETQATPFELRLSNELEVELQRFGSSWLFKWHTISRGIVDVEDFKGGRITLGGIEFGYQQQMIYWHAVGRYLSAKSLEIMERWDNDTSSYPKNFRRSSLDRTEGLVLSFVGRLVGAAVDTDRRLRGRGTPKTDTPRFATKLDAGAKSEVKRIAAAYRELVGAHDSRPQDSEARPMATLEDFRSQIENERERTSANMAAHLAGIEAKRAADGCLISGASIKLYARAIVASLEEFLGYLTSEISIFAEAGLGIDTLVEAARQVLANAQEDSQSDRTFLKLEKACGGKAPREHLLEQIAAFERHAEASFARARLRIPAGRRTNRAVSMGELKDVFVSHASEDKVDFVDDFVAALEKRGLRVWYDKNSMEWGKSVRQLLDDGLANSRFGVVVLSPVFFTKDWTQAELDALLNLESAGGNRILPILHKLRHEDLVKLSPIISGKFSRDTSKSSIEELADELKKLCDQPEG